MLVVVAPPCGNVSQPLQSGLINNASEAIADGILNLMSAVSWDSHIQKEPEEVGRVHVNFKEPLK